MIQNINLIGKRAPKVRAAMLIWIFISLLAFLIVILDTVKEVRRLQSILRNSGTVIGQWTLKDCARHGGRQYTFIVNGEKYYGWESSEVGKCDDVKLGSPVDVVYEVSVPENNFGGKKGDLPRVIINNNFNYIFPIVWSIGIFFIIVLPQINNKRALLKSQMLEPPSQ